MNDLRPTEPCPPPDFDELGDEQREEDERDYHDALVADYHATIAEQGTAQADRATCRCPACSPGPTVNVASVRHRLLLGCL